MEKGIIYRIYNDSKCYYGSTQQTLEQRLNHHQRDYYKWKNGIKRKNGNPASYMSSFEILDDKTSRYEIELVENIETNENIKTELKKRESYYVLKFECVNKLNPYRTVEQKREQRNKVVRAYHHRHKDEIKRCPHCNKDFKFFNLKVHLRKNICR